MDQPLIIAETPKDSTILAYGTAPSSNGRRALMVLGILAVLFLFVGIFVLALRPRLPVGTKTILITTRPLVAAGFLSEETRRHFPASWRGALSGSSWWPVMLGGGIGPNGWEWFAVIPRWREIEGLPTKSAGLSQIVYDQEPVQTPQEVTYGDALKAWLGSPRQEAVGALELDAVSTSSSLMTFYYRRGIVHTSLRFAQTPSAFIPRAGDISLNISALDGAARGQLLEELPIPSFVHFESLKEVHLQLREQGLPEEVQLVHQDPLSRSQTGQVMAGFGVTVKRLIQLADGSVATELTTPTQEISQPITLEGKDRLWIKDTEIRYGSSTDALPPVASSCGLQPLVARFSSRALQKLFSGVGLGFGEMEMGGWQVGAAKDGTMMLCKE